MGPKGQRPESWRQGGRQGVAPPLPRGQEAQRAPHLAGMALMGFR